MANEQLRRYLDQVEGHLQGPGKADILREIESHIWDRAEAQASARGAPVEDADVLRAMEELGEPSDLAVSYSGERHLISPKEYASFWYFTALLCAVHVTMLFFAVATRARFNFFPFNLLPPTDLAGAGAALHLFSLVVQAFLFDAGLVLMVFFLLRNTIRRVDLPNLTFRVETSTRQSVFRAIFALALLLLFAVPNVRALFFMVRLTPSSPDAPFEPMVYSLLLPSFDGALPFILAFLAISFVKDLLYAFLHERPLTVGLDALAWVTGVALCLLLFADESLVGLPADFPIEEVKLALFNIVLARLFGIFLAVLAAIFAARAVKRITRLRQIWGEKDAYAL